MADPVIAEVKKLSQEVKTEYFEATGTAAATVYGGWHEITNYNAAMVKAKAAALTGDGITKLEIIGNSEVDGSGTTFVVEDKDLVASGAPDAVGDTLILETDGTHIVHFANEASVKPKAIAVRITLDNSADVIDVVLTLGDPRFSGDIEVDVIA